MVGLVVIPAIVEFKDVHAGAAQSLLVTVKNTDARTKTLRLRPPKGIYFKVIGFCQASKLAAGLTTTFEVVFQCKSLDDIKELVADCILLQSEGGNVEVPLRGLLSKPDVSVEGDLAFGILPSESKATKRITLTNSGHATASFKLDWDRGQNITFEPAAGELAPSGQPGSMLEVQAVASVADSGSASGEVMVLVNGVEGRRLTYSATVVKQAFELLEENGAKASKVDFGALYFGNSAQRAIHIFNNGPLPAKYVVSFGTAAEMRGRAVAAAAVAGAAGGDAEGTQHSSLSGIEEVENPYAGIIMAARMKNKARASNEHPFELSTLMGIVAPYSRAPVIISFKPSASPIHKGFDVAVPDADAATRDFDYLALVEFSGLPQKLRLPLRGRGMPGGLRLSPPVLDFGPVVTHQWADQLVNICNTNSLLAAKYEVVKSGTPYFECQPSGGTVLPGQTAQLLVRYLPKALGHHQAAIPVRVMTPTGHVVEQVLLRMSGSSLVLGPKLPTVGGTDKLPADFQRPRQFVDSDQAALSTLVATHSRTLRATQQLWDKPEIVEAFADIGKGTKLAMSKAEAVAMKQHRDQAIATMRAAGMQRKYAIANRRIADDDLDLGMNTRSGLRAPALSLPRGVDPLWTVAAQAEAKPRAQKGPSEREIDAITIHKDRPETEDERLVTAKELTKEQINTLIVGPKVLDFGNLSMGSAVTQHMVATNTTSSPIHVVLDLRPHPDLKTSKHTSQVIPAGMRAKFPVTCYGHEVHTLNGRLEYCVNGCHMLSIGVVANIVPVSVELSAEDLHFEFSMDNWDSHVDRVLVLDNPHKFPIEYDLEVALDESKMFSVLQPLHGIIKPGSSGEVVIRWCPPQEVACSICVSALLRITLVGGEVMRKVSLRGETPEGSLKLRDKVLDCGFVACGIPQTRVVQIKNTGMRGSAFRVLPHPLLRVQPDRDRVGPDETVDVEVTFTANEPGPMALTMEVEVRGGRALKLPFKAEGMVPMVEVVQDEFAAGQVYIGSVSRLPVTLHNASAVAAVVTCDLRSLSEFQLEIAKDAWSPAQYEMCPLQRIGPSGEVLGDSRASKGNSATNSSRQSRRSSRMNSLNGGASGFTSHEGSKFHISLLPRASLQLQLVFKPTRAMVYADEIAFVVNTNGVGHPTPVRRALTAESVQPQLVFSRTLVDFSSRVVIRSNQIKAPYAHDLFLTNNEDRPLTVCFGPASSSAQEGGSGVFSLEPQQVTIGGGEATSVSVRFCPRDARAYEGIIPVFLLEEPQYPPSQKTSNDGSLGQATATTGTVAAAVHGGSASAAPTAAAASNARALEQEASLASQNSTAKAAGIAANATAAPVMKLYLNLEVTGMGQYPRLSFDVRECVLPPVPLGVRSEARFWIQNCGYDNLELQYRLPADESHLPMRVEFPEGALIGIAKQRLPVVVTFESSKPLSFTANIDFMDEEGKRYSMGVTGTTDNCLLSHQAFMQVNEARLSFQVEEGRPVQLAPGHYSLPGAAASLGPLQGSRAIGVYLTATTSRGPFENMARQVIASRGKIVVELVEQLSGKTLPNKLARLPSNKKDIAEALLGQHDALLVMLKSHGALLNAVKPEMMLEFDDFCRVMTARSLAATRPEDVEALDLWSDVEEDFAAVSVQAWNAVIQQVFKVFILSRVTLKSFRQLPGAAALVGIAPPEATCVGSNVYSVAESILLAWLTALYAKGFPGKATRVTNFDQDLASGVVLFACLVGYWPALTRRRKDLKLDPVTQQDYQDNADLVVQALQEMGLPYAVTAEDLLQPEPRESMVLVLYLYQTLPQFVPRTTIDFACKLGDGLTQQLELTNPSKKPISYSARLEGHKDFSIDASVLRIEPKGTVRFPVRCTPSTSLTQEARLVFMSRRDGGAHAATLVFQLQSKVNTQVPLRRVRTEGPLYEMQAFDFTVTNPFPADGDFTIFLHHEPTEPLALRKEPGPAGQRAADRKRGSGGRKGDREAVAAVPEGPRVKVWPDAFGLERGRIRLKTLANDKLKGLFLPFTTGIHHAVVVFRDKDQGEFCYELVGEAGLPAPGLELKGSMALENPTAPGRAHTTLSHQAYELNLPYQNSQLEQARRLFLERHPLAKEKDQALLVRTDMFRGADIVYTVSQTNSLISCPSTFTLTSPAKTDDAGAGGASASPTAANSRGGRSKSTKLDDRFGSPPINATAAVAGAAVGPIKPEGSVLRLALKPIGTGIYPTRLLLTSALDVRIVDLELSAQVMTQQFQLEFDCACRQTISQNVPLINASESSMSIKATVEGSCFTGARDVSVQANQTLDYVLTFRPTAAGEHRGMLELLIPATGEKNLYTLVGRATDPLADGHLVLECQARTSVHRSAVVPNVFGAPVDYQVLCDLDCVSGAETLRVPSGTTGTYKLTAWPYRSGISLGTLTFMAPDGQFVWYSVEVRASEPPEMGTIQVSSQVRRAMTMSISLANPLAQVVSMRVQYGHPSLLGPATVVLPAGGPPTRSAGDGPAGAEEAGPTMFECFFAPMTAGDSTARLTFVSEEVGEYVYQVAMHAEPAPAEVLPECLVELGRRYSHTVSIENPTDSATTLVASVSGPSSFTVQPTQVRVEPYTSAEFTIDYSPACLGEVEEAGICISSPDIGDYEYRASGQGELPLQMEMTTVTARLGSVGQTPIVWRNPFPAAVSVLLSLQTSSSTPAGTFELLRHGTSGAGGANKPVTVAAGASLQLPVSFTARTLQLWSATLLVEMGASKFNRQPLTWRYPVTGIAEAADSNIVFKFRCKARGSTEEVMEIQLAGLASVSAEDTFTHELVIPPDARAVLDANALSVTAIDTRISVPDQPLKYQLNFAPRRMLSTSVEFVVYKSTGGRWCFEVQLQATEPDPETTITIEASMGQTSAKPVYLFAPGDTPEPYTATFTSDTPLSFNVLPEKVLRGRLHIHTASGNQFSFDLHGTVPTYVPPSTSLMPVTVDDRLAPSLAARLGKSPEKKNYVASNTRMTHKKL